MFFACNDNELRKEEELKIIHLSENSLQISKSFSEYSYVLKVEEEENLYFSSLKVIDRYKNTIYDVDYTLDTYYRHYKLFQSENVLSKANQLGNGIDNQNFEKIIKYLEAFSLDIANELNDAKTLKYSLAFHNSILNTKKRSLESNSECECTFSECECTLHPGYALDKTAVICQEDYIIPTELLKELASNDSLMGVSLSSERGEQESFKEYVSNLTNRNDYVTFDELYSFYVPKDEFIAQVEALKRNPNFYHSAWCLLGEGSDWGCCGNYGGCCWYWHFLCYAHDWYCSGDCQGGAWYCGWQCEP